MPDVPMMRKTLEHIAAHPEEHNQYSWGRYNGCGTTMCYAGTALVLKGYQLVYDMQPNGNYVADTATHPVTGDLVDIEDEAAKVLGLKSRQAHDLFYNFGGLRELYQEVNKITEGEVEIPVALQTPPSW